MSREDDYFRRLEKAAEGVKAVLAAKGVPDEKISFGGHGLVPVKNPRPPNDANSNFLGNRALGDWAENILKDLIQNSSPDFQAVQYGDSNQIAAGDEGFKDYYFGQLEATRLCGKRPDLLIYPKGSGMNDDFFSEKRISETRAEAMKARGAIEVRSSKFKALRYMAVRAAEKSDGKKVDRECPSFTVKVEDLIIVFRWMEEFKVPQIYAQVFFDSIFAINFLRIFEIIASGSGFKIEKPKQSQEKATIMIPITEGKQIAACLEEPGFKTVIRETRLGRVDAFVAPSGGKFELDTDALDAVFSD